MGHVRARGAVEVPAGEGAGELGDDDSEVANEAEGGGTGAARELIGGYVNLNEGGGRVPFGGVTEVEDPVKAGAENEDHVGLFKGGAAGAGGIVRVVIRHDTFAHRRGEKREFAFCDQVANGALGMRICCPFADDNEGGFGGLEEPCNLRKLRFVGATSWCVRYQVGGLDF